MMEEKIGKDKYRIIGLAVENLSNYNVLIKKNGITKFQYPLKLLARQNVILFTFNPIDYNSTKDKIEITIELDE